MIVTKTIVSVPELMDHTFSEMGLYKYLFDLFKYATILSNTSTLRLEIINKIKYIQTMTDVEVVIIPRNNAINLSRRNRPVRGGRSYIGYVGPFKRNMVPKVELWMAELKTIPHITDRELSSLTIDYIKKLSNDRLLLAESLYPSDIQKTMILSEYEMLDASQSLSVEREMRGRVKKK